MDDVAPSQLAPRPGRRITKVVALPMVSGKSSAIVLVLCFLLSGLAIPLSAHLPKWVEFEIVLVAWWAIWAVAIAWLLYRGRRMKDDVTWAGAQKGSLELGDLTGEVLSSATPDFGGEVGALLGVFVIVLCVGFVLFLAWLFVAVVFPAFALLAYYIVWSLLSHIANDRHGCQGNLGRAAGWGVMWATVYVSPLALAVWGIHVLLAWHPK